MLQDIAPHTFNNEYKQKSPSGSDFLIIVENHQVLMRLQEGGFSAPAFAEVLAHRPEAADEARYLFSIDDAGFFLASRKLLDVGVLLQEHEHKDYSFYSMRDLLDRPSWMAFAGAIALQLARWYRDNTYCGVCATPMDHCATERAVQCPHCGHMVYPKISPVIIVGITNGDELLLTKNASGVYKMYGLVAGFVEIGETLEQACEREVMEEVGLRIKNIRYYKNQPWPVTDSHLVGFYADVEGDPTVTLDQIELSEATWFSREDIPADNTNPMSLTGSMIGAFKDGTWPGAAVF